MARGRLALKKLIILLIITQKSIRNLLYSIYYNHMEFIRKIPPANGLFIPKNAKHWIKSQAYG
jgi:hypothetical protein